MNRTVCREKIFVCSSKRNVAWCDTAIVTLISIAAAWAPGGVIFGPNICIWWPQRVASWGRLTPSQNHNHPEPRVRTATVRLTWQYKLRGKENIGMILSPGRNLKSWNLTIRLFVGLAMPHTQNDNFFNFLLQLERSFKHSSLFVFCAAEARNWLRAVGDNSQDEIQFSFVSLKLFMDQELQLQCTDEPQMGCPFMSTLAWAPYYDQDSGYLAKSSSASCSMMCIVSAQLAAGAGVTSERDVWWNMVIIT